MKRKGMSLVLAFVLALALQGNLLPLSRADAAAALTYEEGAATLAWQAEAGETAWDLSRSEDGKTYVPLHDFHLKTPSFTDRTAQAGHTYDYKIVGYDADGNQIAVHPPFQAVIVAKGSGTPAPVPTGGGTGGAARIVLHLNSTQASVNGAAKTLPLPPTAVEGNTLVPLRFIGEALGARIDWNEDEQKITFTLGGDIVELWVENDVARANGQDVRMAVPPITYNGTTLVPVRFVSENLRQNVQFDEATNAITITGKAGAATSPSQPNQPVPAPAPAPAPSDNGPLGYYFHLWKLIVPGAVIETPIWGTGYETVEAKVGALAGSIAINGDGTYLWNSAWDGKVLHGKWKESGDADYPITIAAGEEGKDWKLGKDKNGIVLWDGYIWKNGTLVPDGASDDSARKAAPDSPVSDGYGTATFDNGDRYAGQFKNGLPDGNGTYTRANGDRFEGGFAQGLPNGQLAVTLADGTTFKGNAKVQNGKIIGTGTVQYPNGARYVGGFANGKPDGMGALCDASNAGYLLDFRDGEATKEYKVSDFQPSADSSASGQSGGGSSGSQGSRSGSDIPFYQSAEIPVYQSSDIPWYQSSEIKPFQAEILDQYQASDIAQYKADMIQTFHAQAVAPGDPGVTIDEYHAQIIKRNPPGAFPTDFGSAGGAAGANLMNPLAAMWTAHMNALPYLINNGMTYY